MLIFFKRLLLITTICISFVLFVPDVDASTENAFLAGGCFWCLEHDLEELPGVISVESGYMGGDMTNPTYANHEGHQEAVKVTFDSLKITFPSLLKSYWRNIDPYDFEGQFCDRGNSYKPIIFYIDESQKEFAKESMKQASKELSASIDSIGVQIKAANVFWLAEDYHQDFAENNRAKYSFYRYTCQRDKRLKNIWGKNAGKDSIWLQ